MGGGVMYDYALVGTAEELGRALGVSANSVREAYRGEHGLRCGLDVERRTHADSTPAAKAAVAAISDEARERLRGLLS